MTEPDASTTANSSADSDEVRVRRKCVDTVRELLRPTGAVPTREDLHATAEHLKSLVPYNYEAWRLHADLLLKALRLLETREMQPDSSFKILAVAFREDDLRDAAESALRQCAHYADNDELAASLVDEANRVRKITWF